MPIDALDGILRNQSSVRVLRALVMLPEGLEVSAREVARRAGVTHPTAGAALGLLHVQGLVTDRPTSHASAYRLNDEHALAAAIRALFRAERAAFADLIPWLAARLVERAPWVREAYVFGSAARGDLSPLGDLDVALVAAPARVAELEEIVQDLGDLTAARYGHRVQAVIGMRPAARLAVGGSGARLWRTILEDGRPLLPATDAVA